MNVWKQVLTRLEQVVERTEYENWFAPTRLLAQKGDTLELSVPSQRHVDEIRERYGTQIRRVLNEISPERLQVHFIIDESLADSLTPISGGPSREARERKRSPRS